MKTNAQLIRSKASQANTLAEAQRLASIAEYEAQLEAEAEELDLEPLDFDDETAVQSVSKQDNSTHHKLTNGFVAVRNGKGFDVTKDGVFKFYTIRLKVAKDYAKQH